MIRRLRTHLSLQRWYRHLLCTTALVVSAVITTPLTYAAGGEAVDLRRIYSGNVDYVAVGASFRDQPNTVSTCSFTPTNDSTVVLNIPVGATILDAYLYFAGSADVSSTYITGPGVITMAEQTNLTLNGVPISTTAGFNERNFTDITGVGSGVVDFFGARRDVSDIVTGPGAYTFAGINPHLEAAPHNRPTTGTCVGAWGLVVIFEDPSITNIRVINLFDGFRDFQNFTFDLFPRNFVVASGVPTGKMTHLSYEGDETLTGTESFQVQIGTGGFVAKTNGLNPINNQYNSTVSGPDVFDDATTWGFDLDTYDITAQLAGQGDAYTATTRYQSGQDIVLLMTEVIAVDNKDLADIEVTLNDVGLFVTNTMNASQYLISVINNGNGTTLPGTGFATGFIHVYDDLPSGISIDNLSDITAPGWDCTATDVGADEVRCLYDLSTLPGGQMDRGDSLPDIIITVDVAAPASPVTNRAWVSLCDNNPDTCTTFDEKHTDASQFDPINYFESTQDLFDILAKSTTNNNVDEEFTPIITGTPSDLSTSTKAANDLNGGALLAGETIEYTITLTETGGTAATGVTVTDVIDLDTENFSYQSSDCGGTPTPSFSASTLTVTNITVPANSSCDVIFRVDVEGTATPGTPIDNTAEISSTNGSGGSAVAPTLLVSGPAAGMKALYPENLNTGSPDLTRVVPTVDTALTLIPGTSSTMTLTPVLATDLDITNGVIPVSVWIEAAATGSYTMTAELRYDSTGANTLIGNATLAGVTMSSGIANAQLFPFQIDLVADITDLDAGEDITLTITNAGGSAGNATVHTLLQGIESSVILDAANVVNVDTITFYDDVGRTNPVTTIETGQTIYIEAVVSDPFGAFDVSRANLTLIDPNVATQLNNVLMTEDAPAQTASSKTFVHVYNVPPVTSVPIGTWVAQITGHEGTEGLVSHTDVNTLDTTAPQVTLDYTVSTINAIGGNTLTYTITITNGGGSPTLLDINNLAIPADTENLVITTLPSGDASGTTSSILDIQNITANPGTTVIQFTVDVVAGAVKGDLINHTMVIDNMGVTVSDIAPSVLIDAFATVSGTKFLYADTMSGVPTLDRTEPASNTSRVVSSQGGSTVLTLSPVLQADLTIDNYGSTDFEVSVWVSRGVSFAGERTIEATLGYTGASTGTIGTDTATITLESGTGNAQYIPFTFDLGSDLTLLANTSITLTITNDTAIAGETITVHSYADSTNATQIAFQAVAPLSVDAVEYFDNDIDLGGNQITTADPNDTVWVRTTVSDPFGRDDVTAARLTVTDPLTSVLLTDGPMTITATQPASGAQRYFQRSYILSAELGDWDFSVEADEGAEGFVQATGSSLLNVNNLNPDLTDSYKFVTNVTTGDLANTNEGDTLRFTIELIETGATDANNVTVTDVIPANTTFTAGTLLVDGVPQPDPAPNINLTPLTVPASGSMTITFDVTVDVPSPPGTVISNSADITNPDGDVVNITVDAQDVVVSGSPASGTKLLYLEDLNTTPILTRLQPQTAGTGDSIILQNAGGTVSMDLTPTLAADITLDPADTAIIPVLLRMNRVGANDRNRSVSVNLGYHSGGPVTPIGSVTQNAFLQAGINSYVFNVPLSAITTIPSGNQIRLTVTNNQTQATRDLQLYSFDSAGNRSTVSIVPDPVINVDSITFWTDTMGAGTQITNADPNGIDVDIYARIIISDPFGDADIQAPDAAVNPTTVVITDPDMNAVLDASTSCTAPCYAFDGEDTVNDPPGDGTRTFYYIVRIDSDPPATRGTWTVQVTANEGLETGVISHVDADSFTTLQTPNLSTSQKTFTNVGDVDPGDTLTYVITLNNTGQIDADNVLFSDTLQSSPVQLTFVSASTTCTDETATPLPNPTHSLGVVSLNNISVTAGGSCTITINSTVGVGTPGELIDNIATIVNPDGPGATPSAPTIVLSESAIPVAGSKQLYLNGIGGANILTRTQPTAVSSTTLPGGGNSVILTFSPTVRDTTLSSGAVAVSLWLSESGPGANRAVRVDLEVDANDGMGFQTVDFIQQTQNLSGTPALRTFSLTNGLGDTLLLAGSQFRLTVTNNQGQGDRNLIVSQVTAAPFSEVVVPLLNVLEITAFQFFDVSGSDMPACAPNCGTEINPGAVESGNSIWARVTAADAFGSFDVNTGCDGVTNTNCPTYTLTDPLTNDQTPIPPGNELAFLQNPDATSRQFEVEVNPAGFGLEGIWQMSVTVTEGVEGVVFDTDLNTFERFGPPVLTVVKSVSGPTFPGSVVTYNNDMTNTGTGPAVSLVIDNDIHEFLAIELTEDAGSWTAVLSLTATFTVASESFDDGSTTFTFDPVSVCGAAIPANSPCYAGDIRVWRIQLNETLPVAGNIIQEYRAQIEP